MSTTQNVLKLSGEIETRVSGRARSHHRPGLDWLSPVKEVNHINETVQDALLIGPADQYQVGEMLKPHVLSRVIQFSRFRCAAMIGNDQTDNGGHAVRSYGEGSVEMGGKNLQLIHFGNGSLEESLATGYRKAAQDEEFERFDSLSIISGEEELNAYVKRRTGQFGDLAYLVAPEGEFYGARTSFHAISLASPESIGDVAKQQLLDQMRQSEFVGVCDETGADYLESEGIDVHRMPCALSVLPQVCARHLREHRDSDALDAIRNRFPNGWIAVEVSAIRAHDFDRLSTALREVSEREGLGLVFFDAGRSGETRTRRWVKAFQEWNAASFNSDNIWEVASLLLHSRLYCGSSLDCRVICMSGGVARINVPTDDPSAASYCELWEHDEVPIQFSEDEEWSDAIDEALEADLSTLQSHATELHQQYFDSLEVFCGKTGMVARLLPEAMDTPHRKAIAQLHHLQDDWLSDDATLKDFRQLDRNPVKPSVTEQLRHRLGIKKQHA